MSDPVTMVNGKYKGTPIEGVPPGYLRRLVVCGHPMAEQAKQELARRGMHFYSIEITAHAVDRASLRLGYQWAQLSNAKEGIHAWLGRMAEEALERVPAGHKGNVQVLYKGIVWAFELRFAIPMLASVWLKGETEDQDAG